jgi:hypothetical protein
MDYVLTATAHGDQQSLAVDGSTLATVTDAHLRDGTIDLEVVDFNATPTTVIFSDFSYTPLS